MREVRAVLVCEGSSDQLLAPHLERLCFEAGADDVTCRVAHLGLLDPPPGKAVADQLRAALRLHPDTNLLFVHRDADGVDGSQRFMEIREGTRTLDAPPPHVAVVPVQETEAWLLTDMQAIRLATGQPRSRTDLDLPPLQRIEKTARPKERLQRAVQLLQSATSQRRRLTFAQVRRKLLQDLDIEGDLRELPSFRRLVEDIQQVVRSTR